MVPTTIHIPGALREFTAGRAKVEITFSRGTVADVLSALWSLYPGVRDRVVNEQGQIRQHVNIFIGNENIRYSGGLASPVSEGAEISIVPAVSGGCPQELRNPITRSQPSLNSPSSAIRLTTKYPSVGQS